MTSITNTCFLFLFLGCLLINNKLNAQAPYGNPGEHTAVTLDNPDVPFGHYEYLPLDFDLSSEKTYALVLFYHGIGEKGNGTTELSKVLVNGPPKMIEQGTDFEAIIISPQSSSGWFSPANFLSLYEYLTNNYPIDIHRVYVTGLSAGGGGTWNALKEHYDKIAAAVPICGAGSVADPSEFLQQTPIWAHHNFNDNVVGKGQTINNMNRIANIEASVMSVYPYGNGNSVADDDYTMQFDTSSKTWLSDIGIQKPTDNMSFTLYKNGNHDAWTKTYNNQAVWDWMFEQNLENLSTPEYYKSLITVYPNPTDNIINFDFDLLGKSIQIYDALGKRVKVMYVIQQNKLDFTNIVSGVYTVHIIDPATSNKKIVKVVKN